MNYLFLRFPGFRYRALTLSYDDSNVANKKMAEILHRYNMKCTFNINSAPLVAEPRGKSALTAEEALSLFDHPDFEVAVHGENHLSAAEVPTEILARDIINDRLRLEGLFGRVIKGMAYANGSFDDKVIPVLRSCGIEYCRTTLATNGFAVPNDWLHWAPTCKHLEPKLMELVEKFLAPEPEGAYYWGTRPRLFYLWGHAHEFQNQNNWEILEKFCEATANRDDVYYATNGEIFEYVKAYDRLRFSADGRYVQNPSAIDMYLNVRGVDVQVPSGKTVKLPKAI